MLKSMRLVGGMNSYSMDKSISSYCSRVAAIVEMML